MKYLSVPEDIDVVNTYNQEPMVNEAGEPISVSFAEFLFGRLCDPAFGASMTSVLAAVKIRTAVELTVKNAIHVIPIEDADFALLKRAVETPHSPYDARVAPSLVPFFEAVTSASDKPPLELAASATSAESNVNGEPS